MNPSLSRLFSLLILLLAIGMLSGCFNRDRQPIYAGSEEIEPIRVPPDLAQPQPRSTFEVPGYSLPELAAQGDESLPPRVRPSAEVERLNSHIRFGPTGLYLEVRDEAESVWRRLGFTLNRGSMSVRDINEPDRRYRFRFDHDAIEAERRGLSRLAFWRSREIIDYSGTYTAEIRPDGDNRTRVALLDENGNILEMERAEAVLSELQDRLG